ncbi:MAG: sigma-70 family RNA polymerase sigma factor [Planctomycetaceae bacterium]|nr:sigma-70 family RNA polymerase sigma factor [Planctomycetaceae bacterium]
MPDTSVSLLVLAGRDGNADAWRRLEAIYSPLLRAWLHGHGVERSDADDLVQDVLLTMSRELPKFEHVGRVGAFRSWLRTTLVHRLRDFWRSRTYRPKVVGGSTWADQCEQLADESSEASREWNLTHDQHVMTRLLEHVRPRFDPNTWDAFWRQMFDGQRADVVAAELGMPLNSVYVARSRVLKTLRREAGGLIDE